jgi:virginiamycin B lyase
MCSVSLAALLPACGGNGPSAGNGTTPTGEVGSTAEMETTSVVAIDPAVIATAADFRERISKAIRVDGEPDFMVVDYGSVWIANFGTRTLDRLDPASNRLTARIPLGAEPCTVIGSGFGSIWVPTCGGSPAVVRVDATRNRVVARIRVNEVLGESGIGVDESGAWLLTAASGELSRIDPRTNKVADTYTVADGSTVVTTGFGSVWVANTNTNAVQRVDPASGEILATISVGEAPRFMAAGEGALWVTNQTSGDVYRIDPQSNQVAAAIDIGDFFSGGDLKAGLGSVWAATGDGPLSRIDPVANAVVEHYPENGADAIALSEGAVWIADHNAKTVYRLAPE